MIESTLHSARQTFQNEATARLDAQFPSVELGAGANLLDDFGIPLHFIPIGELAKFATDVSAEHSQRFGYGGNVHHPLYPSGRFQSLDDKAVRESHGRRIPIGTHLLDHQIRELPDTIGAIYDPVATVVRGQTPGYLAPEVMMHNGKNSFVVPRDKLITGHANRLAEQSGAPGELKSKTKPLESWKKHDQFVVPFLMAELFPNGFGDTLFDDRGLIKQPIQEAIAKFDATHQPILDQAYDMGYYPLVDRAPRVGQTVERVIQRIPQAARRKKF